MVAAGSGSFGGGVGGVNCRLVEHLFEHLVEGSGVDHERRDTGGGRGAAAAREQHFFCLRNKKGI